MPKEDIACSEDDIEMQCVWCRRCKLLSATRIHVGSITETLDEFSHALMFREHTCYCQVCACKEFAKALATKCKLKCPVCQREADRIVVKDADDDERVPALRRCKSTETVREKLDEQTLDMHRAVVLAQRKSSSQIAEGGRRTQKDLVESRFKETLSAIKKLHKRTSFVQKAEVPSQQERSSQTVTDGKQYSERCLTLCRYMEALSAFKKLVDVILDYCGVEVQLQRKSSSHAVAEGSQNKQTYSVMKLCEEAMSTLEEMAEVLLCNCDVEIPDHQESMSQMVAEGKQDNQTQTEDSKKGTYEKTKAAFGKLFEAISASTAVGTPVQQTPSDHTVIEDTWTLRHAPPLQRCESATFSCDNQCPFCETPSDIDHESKCVSSCLASCRTAVFTAAGISAAASRATRRLSRSSKLGRRACVLSHSAASKSIASS